MDLLTAEETRRRLPYPALADAVREALLGERSGEAQAPVRMHLPLPGGGTLLVMPAADGELAVTKLVTVHPGNTARGMETIQGEVVVMEAVTGTRLGVLDGPTVTGRRTAAVSLLAARELAPHPDAPLLLVGAGVQARAHLEAFREGLGTSEVVIASRSRERARALAEHARGLGLRASVADSAAEAVEEVGVIVTATTSPEPVLPEELPAGTFVAAVGSFRQQMAELPPALVASATVVVDNLEGAREEAGDLVRAAESGAFAWGDAVTLGDALSGRELPAARPVVFESVGHSLWDLAAARLAYGNGRG